MAWKNINGSRYYYRNRREGRRVISEYVGSGFLADLESMLDQAENERIKVQRLADRAELDQAKEEDKLINNLLDQAEAMASAALLAAGYYQHKGQWRRRHERNKSD